MKQYRQYIALAVSLLLIVALVYYFPDIVTYVVAAWVLSMIGQPLMRFFQKYIKIGRFQAGPNIAAFLTLITYFVVIGLLVLMFVPPRRPRSRPPARPGSSAAARRRRR